MMEATKSRAPRYSIRRMRLVNFHNLVDETIEVRDGGHLFLLGDNGSGKTTLLDAIHLVLTGTLDVELNAAARIAGGRDRGRSLQGIVLRYDAEHGVMNEGGSITYALLELAGDRDESELTVGVGIEATTMDADVARWGIVHKGSLEDVPIVGAGPAGRMVATREELRSVLGKLAVTARMTDYRRELATRLFGGPALYEEVCRFWSMAKAYREIVARARDFSTLFVRLLPAPDPQVFSDILGSLRALDELEGLIGQLDRQRGYVAALTKLLADIRGHREEIARYRWLSVHLRRAQELEQEAKLGEAYELACRAVEQALALVQTRSADLERARDALRMADARDPDGLLDRLRRAESDRIELDAAREARSRDHSRAEAELCQRTESVRKAHAERRRVWQTAIAAAEAALAQARTLEHPLSAVLAALAGDAAAAALPFDPASGDRPQALPLLPAEALAEVETRAATAEATKRAAERSVVRAKDRLEQARGVLESLEAVAEEPPAVAGFVAATRALAEAEISARPLYELLEPLDSARPSELAALEALAGDSVLASFVVAPADLERARARALPHAGVRVIARTAPDAALAPWIGALFSSATPDEALAALASLLSQAPSLGSVPRPDELGDLEHRGAITRAATEQPRLLGAEARRRAHQARVRAALQAVRTAEGELGAAESDDRAALDDLNHARSLERSLPALRAPEIMAAQFGLERALLERVQAARLEADAKSALERAESARQRAEALVLALSARVQAAGIEELARRIEELRAAETRASAAHSQAVERHAEDKARVHQLSQARADSRQRIDALAQELAARASELRAALARPDLDDRALEQYVRVERRGDQFKRGENVEERLREAERREAAACHEIEGDGSAGIDNIEWAGRFGFSWSSDELTITDRRGEPLANVLARIERELTEQREVVSDKTRDLMDQLVMSDLARELQEQVERLHRTVREMNELLSDLRFGSTRYQFKVTAKSELAEFVTIVRKLSLLDEDSRARFRELVDGRLEEIKSSDSGTEVPELFDYRRWFDYRLSMRSARADETELTRELRALGSGGEQGVPNYLLVLALARLMFDNAGGRVRPLLFDEAFYGIDAGRRDQLLRFATDLGLQLVVASPDQDGVTPSASRTTTLFLVRDEHGDVHLAPYHYWNDHLVVQPGLFPARPAEPPAEAALCITADSSPPE